MGYGCMKRRIPIVLTSMAFLGLYSANVSALPEGAIARLGDGAVGGTEQPTGMVAMKQASRCLQVCISILFRQASLKARRR